MGCVTWPFSAATKYAGIFRFKYRFRSSVRGDDGFGFDQHIACSSSGRGGGTDDFKSASLPSDPALITIYCDDYYNLLGRVANFYFLVTSISSFTSLAPYSAINAILPLIIVIGATMVKEAIEDWYRKQQISEQSSHF